VLDPSAVVAHKHLAHPSEPERTREIDELRAAELRPGEGTPRLLAQLARFLDFPVLFVSVVRGDRTTYRAQRGLPEKQAALREMRRETSYCTHTVSGGAPLVIDNARVEPFFRGSRAVTRFGFVAYAGVPLRTAAGIIVGTLCAADTKAREIQPWMVAVMDVFARRAVAEIERERTPALLASVLAATTPHGDVHSGVFFQDLVAALHARPSPSALVAIRASSPEALLALVDEDEVAGQLAPDVFGLLLPGGAAAAAERLARIEAAGIGAMSSDRPRTVGVSLSTDAETPAAWIARSVGQAAS
jgi:hypothetical protein